jgi:hypothetical protein
MAVAMEAAMETAVAMAMAVKAQERDKKVEINSKSTASH